MENLTTSEYRYKIDYGPSDLWSDNKGLELKLNENTIRFIFYK